MLIFECGWYEGSVCTTNHARCKKSVSIWHGRQKVVLTAGVSVRRRTRKEITRKLTERGLVSIAFGENVSLAAREAVYIMNSSKNGSGSLISCRLIVSCMMMQQPDHLTLFHFGMSYEVGNH